MTERTEYPEEYDFIICGIGYAGAIMTARIAERNPEAKILAIEYGPPIQAATGGATGTHVDINMTATMFQDAGAAVGGEHKYSPSAPLCMADVPGNYNNVAFRPLTDNYQLQQFKACFQGTGLGGNGVYNGALYQEPADWWLNDPVHNDIFVTDEEKEKGNTTAAEVLKPYFDRVQKELEGALSSTPSMDRVHYNHGLYDLVKPYLNENGFEEVEYDVAKLPDPAKRFYTVPVVNAKEGIRTGASAWIEKFMTMDGQVNKRKFPNLTVKTYTEVTKVVLGDSNEVTSVEATENNQHQKIGGLQKPPPAKYVSYKVKEGGKVILSCNALPTARLLYLSGIGPETVRDYVMPSSTSAFKVNNPGIGTTINEHVTTSLGFKYTGHGYREQPNCVHFNPGDFSGNIKNLQDYATKRVGPFTQFGPVVASHFVADLSRCEGLEEQYHTGLQDGEVTTELFYNPFGAGPYPPTSHPGLNPYNGPGTFTVYVMLLRPEMRNYFRLKPDNTAEYVDCYMNDGVNPNDPSEEKREELGIPEDYRELAKRDIATMSASVHEVLEITKDARDIKVNLGPGDGNTHHITVNVHYDGGATVVPKKVSELDLTKIEDVKAYCTLWDDYSMVNGERLPMTHLQENHYHSSAPLARNLDVFGNELGDRKDSYGIDPDTCEVKGTTGLHVVDAGMFPKVVYCHPIGSVMALAEWAADKISPESS